MLTAKIFVNDKAYQRHLVISVIDGKTLYEAQNIFNIYYQKGVILNRDFSDDIWLLTNQIQKVSLNFEVSELLYKRYAEKWIGCNRKCFVDGIKAYILFQMGSLSLLKLQSILNGVKNLSQTEYKNVDIDYHVIEFLKILPGNEIKDYVIENMEEQRMYILQRKNGSNKRILADFNAYFQFNDALEEFWTVANCKQKLFYFPLYFWWKLTAILPLRPTEFLLIPRNCITKENGENILTIRRTKLKGSDNRVFYNINDDYRLMRYSIPDAMEMELTAYINATRNMKISQLETLFVQEAHYSQLRIGVPNNSVYYSYENLSLCLYKFQHEVMGNDCEKNKINLGDTRHLAMINLIISGGSPVICKELAGHSDINISSHYYSNISKFVECATYEMYRKKKSGYVDMMMPKAYSTSQTVKVQNGLCDSQSYISGKIDDCIRNVGTNGEIGNCLFCPHFIDKNSGKHILFTNADERKRQLDADSNYLMYVIESIRKGKGCTEELQTALLRLQHSSAKYSQCLCRNMEVQ